MKRRRVKKRKRKSDSKDTYIFIDSVGRTIKEIYLPRYKDIKQLGFIIGMYNKTKRNRSHIEDIII